MVSSKIICPILALLAVSCASQVEDDKTWTCIVAEDNYLLESDGSGSLVRNGVLFIQGTGHADLVKAYPFYGLPLTIGDELEVSEPLDLTYAKPLVCK